MHVATTKRVRKKLPKNIVLTKVYDDQTTAYHEGIKIQPVYNAIERCVGKILPDRLQLAIKNAQTQGYITKQQATKLKRNKLTKTIKRPNSARHLDISIRKFVADTENPDLPL